MAPEYDQQLPEVRLRPLDAFYCRVVIDGERDDTLVGEGMGALADERAVERMVLAQAVRLHLEHRVMVFGSRTCVFD